MGQNIPLPNRIPMPDTKLLAKMNELGFTINNDGQLYVTYVMPDKWCIYDCSRKKDSPEYYFVDDQNMVRITVTGTWEDALINDLRIQMIKPFVYIPNF